MNYSLAFSYVKNERDWVTKLLITGLIFLIPIVGQLYFTGWLFEIARRATSQETEILPEVNFSRFISIGFKVWVISFVYMLPSSILSSISFFSSKILVNSDSDAIAFIGGSISYVFWLVGAVLAIALSVFLLAAYIRFLDTFTISSAFDFSAVWTILKNSPYDFAILWLFELLTGLIACAGLLFCFIGIIFTAPYGAAVWGHIMGQTKRKLG